MRNPCALLLMCAVACTSQGSEAAERQADTVARRDSIAAVAAATMNEDQAIGLLEQTHAADSALGALASAKGSTVEIKEFGRMILREHHALKREVLAMAQGLRLTPSEPRVAPDAPPPEMLEQLHAGTPGVGWDHAYIEYAIAMHQSAMENSARALAASRSPETKRFIQRSVPIIQKHLDKAVSLRKTFSKADTTAQKR
jgi:putative membrane protein